jgi:tRNA(Ile)-lysidine synthase
MKRMNKNFFLSMTRFAADYPGETYAVAVSGGADSMALLYWMRDAGARIVALTVDHNLRPESKDEAECVAAFCKKIGVRHHILKWGGTKRRAGIEAAAREARYGLLLDYCKKNGVGVLATAHHADDQIETFLMNLSRGSGIYGLAGMRERTERDGVIIFRPLLNVPRAELRRFCDENGVKYFNDKMNDMDEFARVKIRKNRACLAERLGISDSRLLLAIENLGRARDCFEAGARRLVAEIRDIGLKSDGESLDFGAAILLNEPDELRFRALSAILGGNYPIRLNDVKNAFAKLDAGNCKFTLANRNIRKLNGKIRIWKEGGKWSKS